MLLRGVAVALVVLTAVPPAAHGISSALESSRAQGAERHVRRGITALHNFAYLDATREFRDAQQLDPENALAYWGEALTHYQPVFGRVSSDSIRAVLGRFAPDAPARAARARSARERDFVAAAELLTAPWSYRTSGRAFAAAMRDLAEKRPRDVDARTLYALSLFGTMDIQRPDRTTLDLIAATARSVLALDPESQGGLHYLIHALDSPGTARLALSAAQRYGRMSLTESHVVHMPSHIYLQLGMWDSVVSANRRAYDVSVAAARRLGVGHDSHDFHALSWLPYAYAQQGRYRRAADVLDALVGEARDAPGPDMQQHVAELTARHLVETREWRHGALPVPPANRTDRNEILALGLNAVNVGDTAVARVALERARAGLAASTSATGDSSVRSVKWGIVVRELEGAIRADAGDDDAAVMAFRDAVTLATRGRLAPWEVPDPIKPPTELLGEALLRIGRPRDALRSFERSLASFPSRALSLVGAARASAAVGDVTSSRQWYEKLSRQVQRGDSSAPVVREARDVLAHRPTPDVRNAHALVYDGTRHAVVLFGGADAERVRHDTWAWNGAAWRHLSDDGPTPRTFPAVATDSGTVAYLFGGNRVLFGQAGESDSFLADFWRWDGRRWRELSAPGPDPRAESAMAYDQRRRRLVLFGGRRSIDGKSQRLGDTWEFDGTEWTLVARTGPTPRSGMAMAYDESRRVTVLFGGSDGRASGETWEWDGVEWRQGPSSDPRFNAVMTYDPSARRILRFGGWANPRRYGDTWSYDGARWTRLDVAGPLPRNHAALAYDRHRRRAVLVGGHDGRNVFGDVWEWTGDRWIMVSGMPPRARVENGH